MQLAFTPRDLRMREIEEDRMPFPRELSTPPVTKTNFAIFQTRLLDQLKCNTLASCWLIRELGNARKACLNKIRGKDFINLFVGFWRVKTSPGASGAFFE